MRLINTTTYKLEDHVDPAPYAILSHTWHDQEEVLYTDFIAEQRNHKKGYRKIEYLCAQAQKDGLKYAWIDTVCIDKSSSSELSEAINSMFRWYAGANICYVYLDDTEDTAGIEKCRWLTRGWTLQELIAPTDVRFFDKNWLPLGTKDSLVPQLVRWTGVDQIVLESRYAIRWISAATRMSWAASRSTTRVEDMAYCLLGIFDVNLPLIYGEGEKAFIRLQEEILRRESDLSLLAFDKSSGDNGVMPLAQSPAAFRSKRKIINTEPPPHDCEITNKGLQIRLRIDHLHGPHYLGILPCRFEFDQTSLIALGLRTPASSVESSENEEGVAFPIPMNLGPLRRLHVYPYAMARELSEKSILLLGRHSKLQRLSALEGTARRHLCSLEADTLVSHGFEIICAEPACGIGSWDPLSLTSEVTLFRDDDTLVIRKFGFWHQLHEEAFILTFAVATDPPGNTETLFVHARAKPNGIDCTAWFHSEGMNNVIERPKEPGWSWYLRDQQASLLDGDLWKGFHYDGKSVLSESRLQMLLLLLSDTCFRQISLRLEKSLYGWKMIIETKSHI